MRASWKKGEVVIITLLDQDGTVGMGKEGRKIARFAFRACFVCLLLLMKNFRNP